MEQPIKKSGILARFQSVFYGSHFQTNVDIVVGEEPKKEKTAVINKKKIVITIHFNDNTNISFAQEYDVDSKETYLDCYRQFYKWLFFRDGSEFYSFDYRNGAKVIRKSDIKRVDFEYKIEP